MPTIAQLLNEDTDTLKAVIKYSKPSNRFAGAEVPDITLWRFCDVMDISGTDILTAGIKSLTMHTKWKEPDIYEKDAVQFASYLNWLKAECDKIDKLMGQLNKEPDADLVNSGIDKMDKYGVMAIYYGISKDPTDWDRISEIPFHIMYTKLMMDKDTSEIQENYNKMMIEKQKSKTKR